MSVSVELYSNNLSGKFAEVLFVKENITEFENNNLKLLSENSNFKGQSGEVEFFTFLEEDKIKNYILAGLGKEEKVNQEVYKKALAKIIKEGEKRKVEHLIIDIKDIAVFPDDYTKTRVTTETAILAGYKFNKYKTYDKENKKEEKNLNVVIKGGISEAVLEGKILGESTLISRDLVNEPANVMTPKNLAELAKAKGKEVGFDVEIFDEDEIEDLGMGAFLAVAGGSKKKPQLIVMRYLNNPEKPDEINGVVGKGLMYDSGGLSIKPTNSMLEMKSDMSGGAAVIGAFTAIAKAGLKVNVIGVIAACENMISGKSYRPGDILTTMAGKTVFVGNTDAEGRLTLVDAIHYIIEKEKVSNVLDIATLTGAAVVALGDTTTAALSNNEDFYNEIAEASKIADERIWRLPIFDDYREKIKAKEADLTNSAGNPGTITAALFIEAFVQEKPWVHLDIAGPSWTEKEYDYYSMGGTGYGVRTIYHWLKNKSR